MSQAIQILESVLANSGKTILEHKHKAITQLRDNKNVVVILIMKMDYIFKHF